MHELQTRASEIRDWQFRIEFLRRITREWFPFLSSTQRLAIIFVYDRTLAWGKEWERITTKHCSEGIFGKDGTCHAAPFTSCRKRAGTILRSLFDLGMLRKQSRNGDRACRYAFNFDWQPTMKLPKRLRMAQEKAQKTSNEWGEIAPKDGGESTPMIGVKAPRLIRDTSYKGKKVNQTEELANAERVRESSGKGELEMAIVVVRKRARDKAKDRLTDGRALRKDKSGFLPTKARLPLFWRELWLDCFPGVPLDPLPKISANILWTYWRDWTLARSDGEFSDYLRWVFENWNALRVGSFGWATSFPKAPAIRMIVSVKLRPFFEEAYRECEMVAIWRKMEPHERRMAELVEKGMDPDKAREVVEREFATKKELVELRKARERMSIAMETLARRERAAASSQNGKRTAPLPDAKSFNKWKDEE